VSAVYGKSLCLLQEYYRTISRSMDRKQDLTGCEGGASFTVITLLSWLMTLMPSLPRIPVHHFHVLESPVCYGYEGRAATIGRAHKHRIAQFPMNVSGRKYCLNIELVSVLGICSTFSRCFICSDIGHHENYRSNRYNEISSVCQI